MIRMKNAKNLPLLLWSAKGYVLFLRRTGPCDGVGGPKNSCRVSSPGDLRSLARYGSVSGWNTHSPHLETIGATRPVLEIRKIVKPSTWAAANGKPPTAAIAVGARLPRPPALDFDIDVGKGRGKMPEHFTRKPSRMHRLLWAGVNRLSLITASIPAGRGPCLAFIARSRSKKTARGQVRTPKTATDCRQFHLFVQND